MVAVIMAPPVPKFADKNVRRSMWSTYPIPAAKQAIPLARKAARIVLFSLLPLNTGKINNDDNPRNRVQPVISMAVMIE